MKTLMLMVLICSRSLAQDLFVSYTATGLENRAAVVAGRGVGFALGRDGAGVSVSVAVAGVDVAQYQTVSLCPMVELTKDFWLLGGVQLKTSRTENSRSAMMGGFLATIMHRLGMIMTYSEFESTSIGVVVKL